MKKAKLKQLEGDIDRAVRLSNAARRMNVEADRIAARVEKVLDRALATCFDREETIIARRNAKRISSKRAHEQLLEIEAAERAISRLETKVRKV